MSTPAAAPPAANNNRLVAGLEECEQDTRPPFVLNRTELRLLVIAGIGFFLDGKLLLFSSPVLSDVLSSL
jgi:PHS family inorganic phosphate transporter-like MFS transporter